jgi:hypothetical protein
MKQKLRKIVVNEMEFKYSINDSFEKNEANPYGYWLTTLRIFRADFRNTPLQVQFNGEDHYTSGNVVSTGALIKKGDEELIFNINMPGFIRIIAEEGLKLDWDWEKSKLIVDGFSLLESAGYDSTEFKSNS